MQPAHRSRVAAALRLERSSAQVLPPVSEGATLQMLPFELNV
jgi:hypothetical protein